MTKRRRGRPTIVEGTRLTHDVRVRLSEYEYAQIVGVLDVDGCETVSEWVRRAIRTYYELGLR